MFEAIDVLNAFGNPLKLAWAAWLAWGVGQFFWFRRVRAMRVRSGKRVAAPAVKKTTPARPVVAATAAATTVGRPTPQRDAATVKPAVPVAPVVPVVQPPPHEPLAATPAKPAPALAAAPAPAFDPLKAVIEQFGASNDLLDKFVRDFEMQDARPPKRRTRVPEATPYIAESPPAA